MKPATTIPLNEKPAITREKNTAIILSFFLGSFGAQYFYLGNKAAGIFSILFCWTFIPLIVGVVNGFLILLQSKNEFDKKYNMDYCLDCDESIGSFSGQLYCDECYDDIIEKHEKKVRRDREFDIEWAELINRENTEREEKAKKKGKKKNTTVTQPKPDTNNMDSALKELSNLTGLDEVKKEVETLINFIKIQQHRKKEGLKTPPISYHMIFTGNPGTGKTTVARIIARIYKDLGILSQGHLVETDRSGLIAEYQGQTAIKVNNVIDEALDGVLFIDEAYAINSGKDDTYGQEAVATIIKRMEDNRDELVVILAGYTTEIKKFTDTNPGFQSRINRYIDFADYSAQELLAIFDRQCQSADYVLNDDAKVRALEIFSEAYTNRDSNFGNARFVRNVFECTVEKQSSRIISEKKPDKEMLSTITANDISIT